MNAPLQHSQNFIRNPSLVKKLLKKTDLTAGNLVIEIGAGDGVITKELSKVVKKVVALELDPERIENLLIHFSENPNVEILGQNFFDYPLPKEKYKVFSNPPFNRTSEIIAALLTSPNPPESTYLFIQKEAAERFMGDPKMTMIAAIHNPLFETEILAKVHRSEFVPIPSVDVVFVKFRKRRNSIVSEPLLESYKDFVAYLFNQWQPTVLDSLKRIFTHEQKKRILRNLKAETIRPSDLTFKQIYYLFDIFTKYVPEKTKEITKDSYQELLLSQESLIKTHRSRP